MRVVVTYSSQTVTVRDLNCCHAFKNKCLSFIAFNITLSTIFYFAELISEWICHFVESCFRDISQVITPKINSTVFSLPCRWIDISVSNLHIYRHDGRYRLLGWYTTTKQVFILKEQFSNAVTLNQYDGACNDPLYQNANMFLILI